MTHTNARHTTVRHIAATQPWVEGIAVATAVVASAVVVVAADAADDDRPEIKKMMKLSEFTVKIGFKSILTIFLMQTI